MMDKLKERHPWMSEAQLAAVRRAALARAAQQFELAEMWADAAECQARLGRHEQAAELYARAGDLRAAAAACLDGEAFAQALTYYQQWTAQQRPDDVAAQVVGLLGQSACHRLPDLWEIEAAGLDGERGRQLYLQARELAETATPPLVAARCWAAIGAYGDRVERYDLVHTGYEFALRAYGETGAEEERVETLRRYLATVRDWGDRTLTADLEVRLAAIERLEAEPPGWWAERAIIESHPFRDGVRDALHFSSQEQWRAWDALARLEDTPEVDDYLRGLAPPEMVYIPPGAFLMGSGDDDPEARDNEKPQHEVWLRGYYIDKYPVTNEQYRAFMAAGGYENREHWTEAGWNWRGNRREPNYWNDTRFQGERKPVVGVSWYEAVAYSRWAGKSLPAEAQWEKAAGWDPATKTKRRYPWGDEYAANKGNFGRKHEQTTEVGQYPEDSSVYGLQDVIGNVIEWCSTRWRDETGTDYRYPYSSEDGRENLEGGDEIYRIWKGAGWYLGADNTRETLRCGFRYRSDPRDGSDDGGFRCVLPHACATF